MRTKILLSITLFFCISSSINAQVDSGKIFLGGNIGYSNSNINTQSSNNYKNENFGSTILLGKVLKNRSIAGVILSYSNSNNHAAGYPDSNFYRTNQVNAGVFYRKYKMLSKDFYLFWETDLSYSHITYKQGFNQNGSYNSTSNYNGGIFSFFPGLSYPLCNKMQIELLIPNLLSASFYRTSSVNSQGIPTVTTKEKGSTFSVSTNLNSNLLYSFGIGFKLFLGK